MHHITVVIQCDWRSRTWVGLTLVWMFHHLAQLPSAVCTAKLPSAQAEPGRLWTDENKVNPTQVRDHLAVEFGMNYKEHDVTPSYFCINCIVLWSKKINNNTARDVMFFGIRSKFHS